MSLSHIRLIAVYGIRFALRTGGGLVFLIVLLFMGLAVSAAFIAPAEAVTQRNPFLPEDQQKTVGEITRESLESEQTIDLIKKITGTEDEQADYMLRQKPGLLSAILAVLLFLLPFVASLGSANQTAGDIGTRGLRYLLLRTERSNIFFGRFVGTTLFYCAATAFLVALVVLYVQFKLAVYPAGNLWGWGLQGFVALFFAVLPYVAMCALISGMLDSAFASVALCMLAAVFPPLFLWVGGMVLGTQVSWNLDWLPRLVPFGWKYDLLSVDVGERLLAMGVLVGFTAVFLALGYLGFRRRDL